MIAQYGIIEGTSPHMQRPGGTPMPRAVAPEGDFGMRPQSTLLCSIPDCGKPHAARGWCESHYHRWQRHGDPLAGTYPPKGKLSPTTPLIEWIWSKFNQDGPIPEYRPDLGPCWEWTDAPDRDGYGGIWVNRKNLRAHRAVYELLVGPIPDGLVIDHLCRNPICVNPIHMEPVTNRENNLRGESPAAVSARKDHCIRGHPFDEQNTIVRADGSRLCRICRNDRARIAQHTQSVEQRAKRNLQQAERRRQAAFARVCDARYEDRRAAETAEGQLCARCYGTGGEAPNVCSTCHGSGVQP